MCRGTLASRHWRTVGTWNCHGDTECRTLGPGEPGEEEGGTHNMGPEYRMCSPLLEFIGTGADNYSIVDVFGNPASTKAFEVSAGDEHTCARVSTSNGSDGLGVKCWGATNHGELGNGAPMCQVGVICDPKAPNPVPQRVAGVVSAAHLG